MVKISSKMEGVVWEELKALAEENHQNISGVLTEAVSDYLHRHRLRPEVIRQVDASLRDNEGLGRLLSE